jgi:hypothetical protein
MTQTPYEKVFEQTAHRFGLSVGELRQRLEMERATRGPGGRDIMHEVWQDHRRPVVGPAWVLPSEASPSATWTEQPRGSGWQSPVPLQPPPGQAYIEQLCTADTERQRQAAQASPLEVTLVQMMAALLQQNQTMLALLAQQQAAPTKLRRI